MSKTKIIIIIAIFIIVGVGLLFNLPAQKSTTTPTPNITKQTNTYNTPKIIPADNQNSIVDTPENNPPVQSRVILCEPEQRNAEMCTTDFNPVCAKVNIQCIKAPCNPVNDIFSNSCEACKNSLVESYVMGECV